jgi:uncharacterized protein (TIGR02271 family)
LSDATKRNDTTTRDSERGTGRTAEGAGEDQKLGLAAEELSVAKQQRDTGRVRVATHTQEREALVEEDLAREHVEIETVPIGRRVDAVPDVRREGDTTVVPVVEEVLHVERRLILKEEVRIRRVRTTERHREKVTLRHQEAVVTRQQFDPPGSEENTSKPKMPTDRKG